MKFLSRRSMPLASEHDLIAFGGGAEGEVGRFAGLVGHWCMAKSASGVDEFGGPGEDAAPARTSGTWNARPVQSGFVLAAAVNAES